MSFESASDREDALRDARIYLLGAGMAPKPTTALLVSALAAARRSVAVMRERGGDIDEWFEQEMRFPGIRANSAAVAVIEVPEARERAVERYGSIFPGNVEIVNEFLRCL